MLEHGDIPTPAVARRLAELERLTEAICEVLRAESVGLWLTRPNPAFDGVTPLELIASGATDRLWEMVYFLRSGVPA